MTVSSFGAPKIAACAAGYSPISPGQNQALTWSNNPSPQTDDWFGLYSLGTFSNAEFVGSPRFSGVTTPDGATSLVIPPLLPPGGYEIRMFESKSTNLIAKTQVFDVQNPLASGTGNVELLGASTPTQPGFQPGGRLFFRTHSTLPSPNGDYLYLVARNAPLSAAVATLQIFGALTEGVFDIPSNANPDDYYEIRYIRGQTGELWAFSQSMYLGGPLRNVVLTRVWDDLRNASGNRQDVSFLSPTPNANDQVLLRRVGVVESHGQQGTGGATTGTIYFNLDPTNYPADDHWEAVYWDAVNNQVCCHSAPFRLQT